MAYNYQSNYPPTNYGGYGGYGSAYPPNSGPPPPPGGYGGGYGGYHGGGYGGYQMGSAPPPGGQHGYTGYGGGFGGVPGFTMPNLQTLQQTANMYQGQQVQQMQGPPSQQYSSFDNMMQQQQLAAQKAMMEMLQQQKEALKQMQQENQQEEAQEEEQDDSAARERMKADMKRMYLDEVERCFKYNGTLEMTHGTVPYYPAYQADDPVVAFIQAEDGYDITGEKWNAEHDCRYIRDGCKGWGTDDDAIIYVLSTRNNAQRQELKTFYKSSFGKDLVEEMISELSGDYRTLVLGLLVPPAKFDAWCIKEAIYGLGTDDKVLIEILMTRTNDQIHAIRNIYPDVASPNRKSSDTLIEQDIEDDTSGDFKKLLISASQGNRRNIERSDLEEACEEVCNSEGEGMGVFKINYKKLTNEAMAKREAKKLFEAGEEQWGTDEETFIRIFANRDFYQLRETYDEYVKEHYSSMNTKMVLSTNRSLNYLHRTRTHLRRPLSQRDILNSIDRETSGNFRKGLRALVQNIKCRPMFFAQRLKDSMKGLGTDDKTLIRIVVTRSEVDMQEIKACFLQLTEQTLWNYINNDTSFNYKKLLLAIVGKN